MQCGTLYEIINTINDKKYIGITFQKPAIKRWIGHKTKAKRKVWNTPLYNSINKYGVENFKFNILMEEVPEQLLYLLEQMWIKELNLQNSKYGYNLADGGNVNKGYKIPKEVVERRRLKMLGENNSFYGKKHSLETRQKISKANKGNKMSDENKMKMSKRNKGENNPWFGIKGKDNPLYGTHRPEYIKKVIQENTPHRRELYMIDKDNDEIICEFISIKEAVRWIKENTIFNNGQIRSMHNSISCACRGKRNIVYGYKWRFVEKGQTTIENTQSVSE